MLQLGKNWGHTDFELSVRLSVRPTVRKVFYNLCIELYKLSTTVSEPSRVLPGIE